MLCVEGGPTGGVARARSRSEPPNNEHTASVATVIHAADGAFDFRDTLVHVLFLQISWQR